jgi:hypothetical protein
VVLGQFAAISGNLSHFIFCFLRSLATSKA